MLFLSDAMSGSPHLSNQKTAKRLASCAMRMEKGCRVAVTRLFSIIAYFFQKFKATPSEKKDLILERK
jgi:hypothetical protein